MKDIKKIKSFKYGRRNIVFMKSVVIIGMLMLLLCSFIVVADEIPTVMVTTEKEIYHIGDEFNISIILYSEELVDVWMIYTFAYQPVGILHIKSLDIGEKWKDVNEFYEVGTYDNSLGILNDAQSFYMAKVVGESILLNITFRAMKAGTVNLNINEFGLGVGCLITKSVKIINSTVINNIITVQGDSGNGGSGGGGGGDSVPPVPPENMPPFAYYNSPEVGIIGEDILFDGLPSYDIDGEIVKYTWDFNGTIKEGGQVYHNFTTIGFHYFILTVEDDLGATGVTEGMIFIEEGDEPIPEPDPEPIPEPEPEPEVPDEIEDGFALRYGIVIIVGVIAGVIVLLLIKRWFE